MVTPPGTEPKKLVADAGVASADERSVSSAVAAAADATMMVVVMVTLPEVTVTWTALGATFARVANIEAISAMRADV